MSKYGIGAVIQCYYDKDCLQELDKGSSAYSFRIGPESGFNGTDGDYLTQKIYLKNTGDNIAYNVRVTETGDTDDDYFRIKVGTLPMSSSFIQVGTIDVGEVVELTIYSIIPKNAKSMNNGLLSYTISFDSLPIDPTAKPLYIDATDNDNLEYTNTSTVNGIYQEFTLKKVASGEEVFMKIPVRIKYERLDDPEKHQGVEINLNKDYVHLGRGYGYGPYGEPLYGQEGLLHITDNMVVEVPILGEHIQSIVSTYSILTKYTGDEMTIEDIQSYYTEKYMMLGCYDGPALPLWIGEKANAN